MDAVVTRARNYLILTRGAPGLFASNREAMMCHVTTAVYILVEDFKVIEFWKKHLGTKGCEYKTLGDPMTTEWVNALIDDALSILPG